MAVLKPIENRRVHAVATEQYPLNRKCAHPECSNEAVDPHHAFPRSEIGGDSWFVQIDFDSEEDARVVVGKDVLLTEVPLSSGRPDGQTSFFRSEPIPHCTGLCREHHDAVENHDAWIKLEKGVWVWLDRSGVDVDHPGVPDTWETLGDLNPQPGSREGKAKRKRFQGQARATRKTISIRVPDGAGEDGARVLDEQIESLESKIQGETGEHRPPYFTIVDALSYTNLNADESDFKE